MILKNRNPKRRFKEFDNYLENKTFKSCFDTLPNKDYISDVYKGGKYKVIQQGDNPILGKANGKPCRKFEDVILFGDHTLSIYKPNDPFFIATDAVKILKTNIERDYLFYLLEAYIPSSEGYKRHYTKLINTDIYYTENKKEQKAIGGFFEKLDRLINVQKHKIQKLKAIKLSFLHNMFPKFDNDIPLIRFKNIKGVWITKELSEIAENLNTRRVPIKASDREKGNIAYYGANGIQDYVNGYTHSGEVVLIAEDGANDLNDYPVYYINEKIWVNNHAHVVRGLENKLDNRFLSYLFKTVDLIPHLVGGGRAKLNAATLMNFDIQVPPYWEQKAIGNFFETLDHLIELNEQKLNKLEDLKKAFLNEMFV